jgi:hypothetical protein
MKIHEEFGCSGYYGFGNGIDMGRKLKAEANIVGDEGYCGKCPIKDSCWIKHRERARRVFPDLMQLVDEIVATGLLGPAVIREYNRKLDELEPSHAPHHFPTPDISIMMGNHEDAMMIVAGGRPKDRGASTIKYPFGD